MSIPRRPITVRDAYVLSRELRGLSVREESLNRIFTPGGMQVVFVIAGLFAVVAGALILWNRHYFLSVRATNEN